MCRELRRSGSSGDVTARPEHGYLGSLPLPPAGVQDRTTEEAFRAAWIWGHLEVLGLAKGVCPRCSARLEESVDVCASHDPDGLCGECGRRHAVHYYTECTNCIYDANGAFVVKLATDTDLLAFLTARGISPLSPTFASSFGTAVWDYEEQVQSTEPFAARFTFSVDGEGDGVAVDDDLEVRPVGP